MSNVWINQSLNFRLWILFLGHDTVDVSFTADVLEILSPGKFHLVTETVVTSEISAI
jgi:hypothetical protein